MSNKLSRTKRTLIAGLLALAAVLLIVGNTVERNREQFGTSTEVIGQETGHVEEGNEAEGAESKAAHGQEAAPAIQAHTESTEGTVGGINLESPWVIGAFVLLTLLLIAAVFRFGYSALIWVIIVSSLAALFDIREIVFQLTQGQYGITLLALGVALSHLAAAVIALLAWSEGRNIASAPTPVA